MTDTRTFFYFTAKSALYLILLVPLLIWPSMYLPLLTPKVLAFQSLTEVAAAAALVLAWKSEDSKKQKRNPQTDLLSTAIFVFIAYTLVSAVFGISFRRSLWGFDERQDGIVFLAHLLAWLCTVRWLSVSGIASPGPKARNKISDKDGPTPFSLDRYIAFSFWVSAGVALLVLAESFAASRGVHELWSIKLSSARPGGTFGNPLFSGSYLLFHFFYGLAFIASLFKPGTPLRPPTAREKSPKKDGRTRKAFSLKLALALAGESAVLWAILLGQTRSIIFGILAGIILLAVLSAIRSTSKSFRAASMAAAALIVLGVGGTWALRDSPAFAKVNLLYRMSHFSSDENITTKIRLYAWQSALRGFPENPLFGAGHDNSYYYLNRYYNPEHVFTSTDVTKATDTWWDKPHNFYIELLVDKGLAGIAIWLILLAAVLYSLKEQRDRRLAICLGAGLFAYASGNFAAFDNFGSLFGLYLFLAAIAAGDKRPADEAGNRSILNKLSGRLHGITEGIRAPRAVLAVGGMVAAAICLFINLEIAQAASGYQRARQAYAQDPYRSMLIYREAFRYFSPYASKEKMMCAYHTIKAAIHQQIKPVTPDVIDYPLLLASEAAKANPEDVQIHLLRGDMFNGLGLYLDAKYLSDAQKAGEKALELSPTRHEAMFNLGRTYLLSNQAAKAVELNRKALALSPQLPLAHWLLGLSLLADNRKEEARSEVRLALQMGYRFRSDSERDAVRPLFDPADFDQLIKTSQEADGQRSR
jgi:O-antigen ligase